MSKPNSGQSGNRSFGLDHQNGKGSASRITDIKAYRENFDEIEWSRPLGYFASTNTHRILGCDEIVEAGDEYWGTFSKCWKPVGASVGYTVAYWFDASVAVRRPIPLRRGLTLVCQLEGRNDVDL